jgi:retron-type reverse transcriptase
VKREDRSTKTKPFEIAKRLIWESWKQVAANDGAPGVDKESIQMFHSRAGGNLYTLWNRMSSESYYPKPVRQVLFPKGDGKLRALGIPAVADRVAQMAVKNVLEGRMEALRERLADCGLEVHREKTHVVYCKDGKRRGAYPATRFDFLGFSFHARTVQDKEGDFLPASAQE